MSLLLVTIAGVITGLVAVVGGLGSMVSYPSLLMYGLPPISANVTNTVGLTSLLPGSLASGRRELRGIGRRVALLAVMASVGGAIGSLLLLRLPAEAFIVIVPFLIAGGSLLVMARDRIQQWSDTNHDSTWAKPLRSKPVLAVAILLTGIYCGYFGAAAGVLMLAILSIHYDEPHAVTNAVRMVLTSAANCVAAVFFILFAPVYWPAAIALAIGLVIGNQVGFMVVPRLPAHRLRTVIGITGLVLAAVLARGAMMG